MISSSYLTGVITVKYEHVWKYLPNSFAKSKFPAMEKLTNGALVTPPQAKWLTFWLPVWVAIMCYWHLEFWILKPCITAWRDSLIIGIYPAVSAQRYVLMYKNNIHTPVQGASHPVVKLNPTLVAWQWCAVCCPIQLVLICYLMDGSRDRFTIEKVSSLLAI